MFIVGMVSWWYSSGWKQLVMRVRANLLSIYDYFSFDLLLRTLFSPFRQISAGSVRGSINVQIQAMFDNLISRTIGAIVRSTVLMFGVVTLVVAGVIGLARVIVWPLVPILPIVCMVWAITGWVPWKI